MISPVLIARVWSFCLPLVLVVAPAWGQGTYPKDVFGSKERAAYDPDHQFRMIRVPAPDEKINPLGRGVAYLNHGFFTETKTPTYRWKHFEPYDRPTRHIAEFRAMVLDVDRQVDEVMGRIMFDDYYIAVWPVDKAGNRIEAPTLFEQWRHSAYARGEGRYVPLAHWTEQDQVAKKKSRHAPAKRPNPAQKKGKIP